jgi:hypothetical protein
MLWLSLLGCSWRPEVVETECAPLRLSTGRPECDGIALCVETTTLQSLSGTGRTTSRSWVQNADGAAIPVSTGPVCRDCEPSLRDLVCAEQPLLGELRPPIPPDQG